MKVDETENVSENTPGHLILEDKVYQLSVSLERDSARAFRRGLVDFLVKGTNPLTPSDRWRTLLGISEELYDDYPSLGMQIPWEWILFRFLCHHVRANSIHLLKKSGGQVLITTTFRTYLGSASVDRQADEILRTVLSSWVRTFPKEPVEMGDLFVSTDMTLDTLRRSINSLKLQDQIEEVSENTWAVKPSVLSQSSTRSAAISFDRRNNRYYQEVVIQADEPFCFIMMPFREEEFHQSIYFDVIKPFIENRFRILCYRVDEDDLPDRIDNKIYSYILRAAFIVAEVTTRNPNVLYELGLAHMLEKDCIILSQAPHSEIPFDINRISAERYDNEDELRQYMGRSISALGFKYFG